MVTDPMIVQAADRLATGARRPVPGRHRGERALLGVPAAGWAVAGRGSRACYGPCLLVLCLVCAPGCGGARVYNAASLPAEFRVGPTANTGVVNLTRLASPTGSDSLIGQGDLLELTIATGYEMDRMSTYLVRVDDSGSINVPLVGTVPVAGLEPGEAEPNVAAAAVQRGVYQHPYVTLTVKRQRTNKVTVVGAVELPGTYQLPHSSSDLLGALAAAGGLTDEAGVDVEVLHKSRRAAPDSTLPPSGSDNAVASALASYTGPPAPPAKPEAYRVNLEQISAGETGDFRLGDGDVVMVFPRQPRVVHVMGLVHKAGQIEIPPNQDIHLLDAITMAGGRTTQVADKVQIIRRLPDGSEPLVVMASVREAKANGQANLRLAPGDLVSVEETPVTFALDLVRSMVRFGFSAATPLF